MSHLITSDPTKRYTNTDSPQRSTIAKMIQGKLGLLLTTGSLLLLTGCATSVLQPYPQQMKSTRAALGQPITTASAKQTPTQTKPIKRQRGPDQLLHLLEQARIAQLEQADDISLALYKDAITQFESQAFDAHLDLSNTAQTGTAFLVNDNARQYKGENYERSFIHLYQALNYVFQQDLEGAGVEVRRLNRIQKEALANNEKILAELDEKAQTQLSELPIDSQSTQTDIAAYVDAQDAAAQSVKHGFQNAYGYFISGLIYELRGEKNDAYIDYKKAQALNPQVPFLQTALLRLSRSLGFTQEHQRWQQQFKISTSGATQNGDNVIVLYESGLVPEKKEAALSIPDLKGRYHSFSFPYYAESRWGHQPLHITSRAFPNSHQTFLLTDTYPLAAKALKDKRTALIARQLSRSIAKAHLHHVSEKEGGALGSVLANIYNIITERADLRSWLTLPRSLQATRFSAPIGKHTLNLQHNQSGANFQYEVAVKPNSTTLLYVVTIGQRFYVRSVLL